MQRRNIVTSALLVMTILTGAFVLVAGSALESAPEMRTPMFIGLLLCAVLSAAYVIVRGYVDLRESKQHEPFAVPRFIVQLCIALGFLAVTVCLGVALASGQTPAWIATATQVLGWSVVILAIANTAIRRTHRQGRDNADPGTADATAERH